MDPQALGLAVKALGTPRPCKFGLAHTRKAFGGGYGGLTSTGTTFATLLTAEAPFAAVRLVFHNHTASPQTIDAATVAASASINDGVQPVDTLGAAVSFTAVTFSGSASGTVPAGSGSGNNIVPGVLVSDIIYIKSFPRTDGGTLPLLMARQYSAAAVTYVAPLATQFATQDQGRVWRTYSANGNLTSVSMGTPTLNGSASVLAAAIVYTEARGLSVLGVGDSLTQGYGSTSNQAGAGHIACATVSTPGKPVIWANGGYVGQNTSTFYTNAKAYIGAFKPDVLVYPIWSPNDALTQAAADASYGRAMDIADYCIGQNIVPILTTPIPYSGTNATTDAYRLSVKARALSAVGAGFLVADYDGVISDNASPARIKSAFNVDGTHVNDAGYAAEAAVLAPLLQKILAGRPN